jgi:hypothetical protein
VNRRFLFLVLAVIAAGAAFLGYAFKQRLATATEFDRQVKLANAEAARIREQIILPTEKRVPAGDNFVAALQKFGLSAQEAANASAAAQRAFNLRQVRAGNTITVGRSVEGILREIDYKIDTDRMLKIVPDEQGFSAQIQEIPSRTEVARAIRSASYSRRRNIRTGRRPAMEKFSPRNMKMREGNTRRCSSTIRQAGRDTIQPMESPCRRPFFARR